MKKVNLTEVQAAGEFKRPTAGAYICGIAKVEDIAEREYLKIYYDIVQGEYKGYYTEMRKNNPDWKWAGAYCRSYKPSALGMFKRFCDAVSNSNGNYVFDPSDDGADETELAGKAIGLVFREEEYYSNSGDIRTRLVVDKEFPISELDKQKVPPIKKLPPEPTQSDFKSIDVDNGVDEEVPF